MSWLLPLWSTYVECCCNCPLFCGCCMLDVVFIIGWVTQFDNWIGVPDTGDWFEEPPNNEDEEEIIELFPTFRTTSERPNQILLNMNFIFFSYIFFLFKLALHFQYLFLKERRFDHSVSWTYVNNQTYLMARRHCVL